VRHSAAFTTGVDTVSLEDTVSTEWSCSLKLRRIDDRVCMMDKQDSEKNILT